MGLVITGSVSGGILVGAMLKAHAVTSGNLSQKQAAGVGFLSQHLNSNTTAMQEWKRATHLSPEQVLARASLKSDWLKKAGEHIEATTDLKIRAGLLEQIITPRPQAFAPFGPNLQEVRVAAICNSLIPQLPEIELEMCPIPAGKFKMGSSKNADERFTDGVQHNVTLSAFNMGKYEITNAQYGIYMQQTGVNQPEYCDDPKFGKKKPSHPVVGVNWDEAMTFTNWLGMRLPTEAEGEYASRGTDDTNRVREYPWGDVLYLRYVTFYTKGTRPVNAHCDGKSFFEVWDLSGNVWEWRNDWYDEKGYNPDDLINPQGPSQGIYRVLRGGSWYNDRPDDLRSAFRDSDKTNYRDKGVGFRAAEDLK